MKKIYWFVGIILFCSVAYALSIPSYDGIRFRPGTLPVACIDGVVRLDSTDNKLKKCLNDLWSAITGSGSGGVTGWEDFQANDITKVKEDSDYTTYAGTPDDSASNLSITLETTAPLSGDSSYLLTKAAANASGQAWILPLKNPENSSDATPDRLCTTGGETQYLTFKYETSANYDNSADERLLVYIYGNSSGLQACNARNTLSGDFNNQLPVAPSGGQLQCAFNCGASDTQIDAVLAYSGTAVNAVTIKADLVKAGSDATITAPIVSYQGTYNPTLTNLASGSSTLHYWRIGDKVLIEGVIETGGAAGGTIAFDLPSGLTIDVTKMENGVLAADQYQWLGDSVAKDVGTGYYIGHILRNAASTTEFIIINDDTASGNSWNATVPFIWASGDTISIKNLVVPITEWANSNAILSTTQADLSTAKLKCTLTASTANSSFADVAAEIIDFDDCSEEDTHNAVTTGASWKYTAPFKGSYDIKTVFTADNVTNLLTSTLNLYKNGSFYRRLQATGTEGYALNGALSVYLQKDDYIDVRYYQDDSASGARSVYTGASGFTNITISGEPDFSAFSVHGPYEVLESFVPTAAAAGSASTWLNFTTLELTPGTWDLEFLWGFVNTAVPTNGGVIIAISEYSGTTTTDHSQGDNTELIYNHKVSGEGGQVYAYLKDVVVTSTKTYYFKNYLSISLANMSIFGKATAVRKK